MPIIAPQSALNVRSSLVYFAAVAMALPMAIISIAKLLLLLGALTVIARGWLRGDDTAARLQGAVSPMILLSLAVMAVSIAWTTGSTHEALAAIGKHGKLLLVPVLLCLIRSRREAMFAVAFFVGGQVILLISTWLMFVGIAIPWATSREAGISYAVFSSYLDQSIMTAVLAAVCWHMRSHAPARYRMLLSPAVSVLALACVFFVFKAEPVISCPSCWLQWPCCGKRPDDFA